MREILFRGKRIDSGKWTEGGYKHEKVGEYFTAVFIIEHLTSEVWENHRVDPATVGQFTGLTDKNGKKIFEGDIVRCKRTMCDEKEMVGHIVYDDCCFSVKENKTPNQPAMDLCDDFEVIGNIHDNPELIGGKGNA